MGTVQEIKKIPLTVISAKHVCPWAVQELCLHDSNSRITYSWEFRQFIRNDVRNRFTVTCFSDEACFNLSGYVNSQNFEKQKARSLFRSFVKGRGLVRTVYLLVQQVHKECKLSGSFRAISRHDHGFTKFHFSVLSWFFINIEIAIVYFKLSG